MTDIETIDKVALLFNNSSVHGTSLGIQRRWGGKKKYATVVYGPRAIGWMMTLYSLMSERRKSKIREVINFWYNKGVQVNA